ncbi:hypothetical protein LSUB1_G007417 [Lachnellula subtilissima]|uniref:Uncharacterized protein n=1 Tax=Lachnellula subtilissima TaxID=602034 RepID=A0A8H8U7Z0_9HELO|nr:hypothetical protein LSUB1_G007417 [Lachnellula subtilissima]
MSDYPATPSYGMGYGAHQDQNNPPYLPPMYPNQYQQQDDGRMDQAGMPSSYDASGMPTYGYNGATPFSASAIASGVPPLPIYQGWNQDPVPLPPYAPANPTPQYGGYSNGVHQNPQYYPPPQPTYQHNQPTSRPYDEGELSEGEFEGAAPSYGTNQYRPNDGKSHVKIAQRSGYPVAHDQNPQSPIHFSNKYNYPARDSPQMRPQQSDAYPPYNSPRPTDHGEQAKTILNNNSNAPDHTSGNMNGASQNQQGWIQDSAIDSSKVASHTNGHHPPLNTEHIKHTPATASAALNPVLDVSPFHTVVAEARKKAENAILNLWVHEVRFQQYIDEGVSEDILGPLFDDLKLSKVPSKTINDSGEKMAIQSRNETHASREENTTPIAGSSLLNMKDTQVNGQFAPLSTLPNGHQPTMNGSVPGKASTLPSAIATTAATKPTGMTDKEKTLQSKMEALRKSREERAQKAAAKISTKSPTSVTSTQVQLLQPTPASAIITKINTSSTPLQPALPPSKPQVPSQSPVQNPNTQPQGPVIPGLFLASTGASPAPSLNAQSPIHTQAIQRKRPVAADFDTPASAPFKRPFGQSRNDQPLVIDVSEEEPDSDDEDVAMDLESQADQDSPVQSSRKMSDQRSMSMHNLPPLTNFPARKPFTSPPKSSAPNTPPVTQNSTKASIGHPKVLQQMESELETLKKKIIEAEARKKARQPPSGTRTPRTAELTAIDVKESVAASENLASKVEASMKMQDLIDITEKKVGSEIQKLAEAQAAELEKEVELRKNEAEIKRLRREKLKSDLPLVNAEVQQSQTKLEQLKAEIASLEAEVEKNLEAKRKMAEEMERLGQETEDQLQAQKNKLQDLTQEENVSSDASSHPSAYNTVEATFVEASLPVSDRLQTSPSAAIDSRQGISSGDGHDHPQFPNDDHKGQEDTGAKVDDSVGNGTISTSSQMGSDSGERITTDQALEAALQDAVRAEADIHGPGGSDVDMETSFAPDPTKLAPESSSSAEDVDSPMYSPVLGRAIPHVPEAESDNYEPPEATPAVDEPSPVESPPFSPAPPDVISESSLVDDSIQVVDDGAQGGVKEILPEQNGSVSRPIKVQEKSYLNRIWGRLTMK